MKPEVSVIMSEYNTELNILKASIESILNQTYTNFEFIIINDGSSNNLENIVKKLNDERILIINNEVNLGLPASLNKAIRNSKGDYLVRMDTDDVAHNKRIEVQLDFIKNNPQYSVVGTSINLVTDGGMKTPKVREGEIDRNKLLNRNAPVHPSVIMNKKDIVDVGMYQNLRRGQDFALWAELILANKKIYVLPDILLDYRVYLSDYKKRKLKNRLDEIKYRFIYYKKLKANPMQFISIFKSVIAGILPGKIMAMYHKKS